jgi:DNA processing protein
MDIVETLLTLTFSKTIPQKEACLLAKNNRLDELAFLAKHAGEQPREMALREKELALSLGCKILPCTSQEFPQALFLLADCPLCLYLRGTFLQSQPALAIIGTRAATEWGKESARIFAKHLASQGVLVISGLARGIDTHAHKAALAYGNTLAVIGSGFSHLYPKENTQLAEEIIDQGGGLISEFTCNTPPTKSTFPKRNRIISILSSALLLIEAPVKSGAMITMNLGKKQKKPLFCLPGRALHPTYAGNHHLIKTDTARLVDTPEELLSFFKIEEKKQRAPSTKTAVFTEEEKKVLDLLSQSEVSLDALSCLAGLSLSRLQATLIQLQIKNFIAELPGKRYIVKR